MTSIGPEPRTPVKPTGNLKPIGNSASRRVTEQSFIGEVVALCKRDLHKQAADYYIDNVAAFMALKINRKEKLNALMYLPRLIQAGAATKHGYAKLLSKAAFVEEALAGHVLPEGGAFIDLGCGAHDPVALATYYYLNGFAPCYGIDLLKPRNAVFSALSMYDILVHARSFTKKFCREGSQPGDILKRLQDFRIGTFEKGNFAGALAELAGKVEFLSEDIRSAAIPASSVSLLVSFAVLEHVSDIGEVCRRLYEILMPGGFIYHFVDLQDHRTYSDAKSFTPLSFLAEEEAPANMNRLRAPEITHAHLEAGFEILKDGRTNVEVTDDFRAKVVERFQKFTSDELGVTKQVLLVRKPLQAAASG